MEKLKPPHRTGFIAEDGAVLGARGDGKAGPAEQLFDPGPVRHRVRQRVVGGRGGHRRGCPERDLLGELSRALDELGSEGAQNASRAADDSLYADGKVGTVNVPNAVSE